MTDDLNNLLIFSTKKELVISRRFFGVTYFTNVKSGVVQSKWIKKRLFMRKFQWQGRQWALATVTKPKLSFSIINVTEYESIYLIRCVTQWKLIKNCIINFLYIFHYILHFLKLIFNYVMFLYIVNIIYVYNILYVILYKDI